MIPGLIYEEDFLTPAPQENVLRYVDGMDWDTTLARRVQHYGYRYDYRSKEVSDETRPIPHVLGALGMLLERNGWFDRRPEQVIVNEYLPGQGIAMHTDAVWGPVVATISLGDDYIMDFDRGRDTGRSKSMLLRRGSVLVLTGDARYEWRHGIAKRKSDGAHRRQRRVSLTFRTLPR